MLLTLLTTACQFFEFEGAGASPSFPENVVRTKLELGAAPNLTNHFGNSIVYLLFGLFTD